MANLITFETEFGVTFKRVMSTFTTEYAVRTRSLIWTLLSHMAKLFTISAFNSWIRLYVVPSHLVLKSGEEVFSTLILLNDADLIGYWWNQG